MILWWCMLLLSLLGTDNKWVRGQFDSNGFISIDCGLSENDSYIDEHTKLSYISDAQFIDTGLNHNISKEYTPSLSRQYLTVRSFNSGARNCYSLKSLVLGSKYLIRATFLYGNYDGLNQFAMFDLYLGVNFWKTVNISDAVTPIIAEVITVAPADYVQVCLANTGGGTPFISSLDLRPLKDTLYLLANSTQSLSLVKRLNAGPTNTTIIRYPDDLHDRLWEPWSNEPYWSELTTTSDVSHILTDQFEAPSIVFQTAATPVNSSVLQFDWAPSPLDKSPSYWWALHFCETQLLGKNQSRWFNITVDGLMWYAEPYSPSYLRADEIFGKYGLQLPYYNVSLVATGNSTLPPLLNAFELFIVLPVANLPTDGGDVSAINAIKEKYQIKKNWVGDPCAPETYIWDGLNCSYTGSPRIIALNLASNGLMGDFPSLFSELKALQSLNLSDNNLTGSIPDALSLLASLTLLDLTGNNLNGTIPDGLLRKSQAGKLTLRVGDNPNLCSNSTACTPNEQKKDNGSIRVIAIIVPVIVVVLLVALALLLCMLKNKKGTGREQYSSFSKAGLKDDLIQLENRQFTYTELAAITNEFTRILGKGGFGTVYHGTLEDGTQVAVKVRSESSSQGTRDFLGEAEILAKVHHKFLVSMIGYCKEESCVALVFEYISRGTLQEHLQGPTGFSAPLTWRQRVRIAKESAQGLEYLHKGCSRPLIHRDVKTNNILLNEKLEAKIADFGLSKAINSDQTHVTTCVVGTAGYFDPEYCMTSQLTEKSDVYSFGIVLLELITGQKALISASGQEAEKTNIVYWVRQRLAKGNIESIVDARMKGEYDANSVWKVTDLALKCTMPLGSQRPMMPEVVAQLKECMESEVTCDINYHSSQNSSIGTTRNGYYTGYSINGDTRS
ncbi:Leucine-rich repeat protein kinase family protein [Rhynchospora pubera]|nr:Leucine-rich repeat protein kinase family protein [Rhynchospora pubera]